MMSRFFQDPMARKELGSLSRRWQTYFVRVVYVGGTALVLYLSSASQLFSKDSISPSEYAAIGRDIFRTFVTLEIASLSLLSITAGADMLTKEVRGKTLGLLGLTLLAPWGIVMGKWKAAMMQSLLLFFCGLPVVVVAVYLGGAGPWDLAWSSAIALSMASLNSALAIRFSATCRAPYSATLAALFSHLGILLLAGMVVLITLGSAWQLLVFLHPLFALFVVIWPSSGALGEWTVLVSTLCSALATGVILRSAARCVFTRLRSDPELPPRHEELAYQAMLDRGNPARPPRPREVWQNHPILWKDLTLRPSGRLSYGLRAAVGSLLLMCIYISWPLSNAGERPGVLYFWWSCFLVLALANGSVAFVDERSGHGGEPLLVTPLSGFEIVRARLLGGVLGPESRWMGLLFVVMLAAWSYWAGVGGMLMVFVVGVLSVTVAYLTGAAFSLRASTLRAAFGAGMGILCVTLLGPYFLRSLTESLPQRSRLIEGLAYCLETAHPFSILGKLAPRGLDWDLQRFLAFLLVYGTLGAGLVFWMARRFDRLTGRS